MVDSCAMASGAEVSIFSRPAASEVGALRLCSEVLDGVIVLSHRSGEDLSGFAQPGRLHRSLTGPIGVDSTGPQWFGAFEVSLCFLRY